MNSIYFLYIALAVGTAFMFYVFFFTKSYLAGSTKRQLNLGRKTLARWQNSTVYFIFLKVVSFILMIGMAAFLYILISGRH